MYGQFKNMSNKQIFAQGNILKREFIEKKKTKFISKVNFILIILSPLCQYTQNTGHFLPLHHKKKERKEGRKTS